MAMESDTIAAIASAPGRAAVGIVRVSGSARDVQALGMAVAKSLPEPRRAMMRRFSDTTGTTIDTGILIHFPGPASYTGEDVLEFQVHGSTPVLQGLLQACLDAGARPARPGEFTERAWLNGRMDLLQAEAVADLIDARSQQAAQLARRVLGGAASRMLQQMESQLASLHAQLEASIDFAEETADAEADAALLEGLAQLAAWAREMGEGVERGLRRREGMRAVIVGPPNAGKSSLFNRLLRSERALVSADPGTTRDVIDAELALGGVNLRLCDTAGMRATASSLEAEGVRRAHEQLLEADVWLFVSAPDVAEASRSLLEELLPIRPVDVRLLHVINKTDLTGPSGHPARSDGERMPEASEPSEVDVMPLADDLHRQAAQACTIRVSARTGAGIELLEEQLRAMTGDVDTGDIGLSGARHARAISGVAAAVEEAREQLQSGQGPELAAEALRLARREFDALFGRHADPEALLGEIFARFCIGK